MQAKEVLEKLEECSENRAPCNRSFSSNEEGGTSRTVVPQTDAPTELAQIKSKLHEISEMLHHSEMEKDNGLGQYCHWKGQRLHWQVAESTSQSIASSQSDLFDSF